jgi:hypothetical protein
MESIYVFYHQIYPRVKEVLFGTTFMLVGEDRFFILVRPVGSVFKTDLWPSLSRTEPCFFFPSSSNRHRFLSSSHGDLRTPPWNPCSKLGFGALNRGKGLPSLSTLLPRLWSLGETGSANWSYVLDSLVRDWCVEGSSSIPLKFQDRPPSISRSSPLSQGILDKSSSDLLSRAKFLIPSLANPS